MFLLLAYPLGLYPEVTLLCPLKRCQRENLLFIAVLKGHRAACTVLPEQAGAGRGRQERAHVGPRHVGVMLRHMVNLAPESCKDSVSGEAPRHMPPAQESQQRCFQYAFCWHLPQAIHLRPPSQGCLQTAEEPAKSPPFVHGPHPSPRS